MPRCSLGYHGYDTRLQSTVKPRLKCLASDRSKAHSTHQVDLVNEEYDLAARLLHLLEHLLQRPSPHQSACYIPVECKLCYTAAAEFQAFVLNDFKLKANKHNSESESNMQMMRSDARRRNASALDSLSAAGGT
jgi:hypothetical protein